MIFVDLSIGCKALGGSCLAQVFSQVGDTAPDVRDTQVLKDFFDALDKLRQSGIILAYHERSDGGLFTTLVEMQFAGRCGIEVIIDGICASANARDVIEALFNEELGVVMQIRKSDETEFKRASANSGPPPGLVTNIGKVSKTEKQELVIYHSDEPEPLYRATRTFLQKQWGSTSYHMAQLRGHPDVLVRNMML